MKKRTIVIVTTLMVFCFCQQILVSGQEDVDEKYAARERVEQDIEVAIEKANYCESTDDCMHIDLTCPFGCGAYINKKEETFLQERMKNYLALYDVYEPVPCFYMCVGVGEGTVKPECINQRCVPVCEPDKLNKPFECECPKGTKPSGPLNYDFKCVTEKEE